MTMSVFSSASASASRTQPCATSKSTISHLRTWPDAASPMPSRASVPSGRISPTAAATLVLPTSSATTILRDFPQNIDFIWLSWLDLLSLAEGYRHVAVGREIDGGNRALLKIGIIDNLQEPLQLLVDAIEAKGNGHILP